VGMIMAKSGPGRTDSADSPEAVLLFIQLATAQLIHRSLLAGSRFEEQRA
jgi:hypothetical protein